MKFSDKAIILSQKNYSENSAIIKILTENHGIYKAFISAPKSKKNQAIFQVGNLISFEWRSRIEEALGNLYYVDLIKSFSAKIIFDKLKLSCCSSLFSMIDNSFMEREPYNEIFVKLYKFLLIISDEKKSNHNIIADYIRLELDILKALGYGVDFSACVVTNSQENLAFVSPKSARAVSFDAGVKYSDKLLKLPQFLLTEFLLTDNNIDISQDDLKNGLKLSGFFLEKFVFAESGNRPISRQSIEIGI